MHNKRLHTERFYTLLFRCKYHRRPVKRRPLDIDLKLMKLEARNEKT
jgi:hypothetical protein